MKAYEVISISSFNNFEEDKLNDEEPVRLKVKEKT